MNLSSYLILAALLTGVVSGYEYRDAKAEAERVQAVEAAVEVTKKNNAISRSEEIALIKSQQKTKVVYKTITKEVPKYVSVIQKTDSECNLSVGTVRLFNSAALERMSKAAGVDDSRDTKSSTVTESQLINYSVDVIDRYNRMKNQCNALISWHENIYKKER